MLSLTATTSTFAGRKAFVAAPRQQSAARGSLKVSAYQVRVR